MEVEESSKRRVYMICGGIVVAVIVLFLILRYVPGAPFSCVECPTCIYDADTCANECKSIQEGAYKQGYSEGVASSSTCPGHEGPSPQQPSIGSTLVAGSMGIKLYPGFQMNNNHGFLLVFQADGNFGVYDIHNTFGWIPVDFAGSNQIPATSGEFTSQGTLRLFDSKEKEIYTLTPPSPGNTLQILQDGSIQISDSSRKAVWSGRLDSIPLKTTTTT